MDYKTTFSRIRYCAKEVATLTDEQRDAVLTTLADSIVAEKDFLLAANAKDLAAMPAGSPLYDRLRLTDERLEAIAADMRNVAALPSPLGRTLTERTLENGLRLRRVSVPFGVIGVIYEARPNVSFDVFALCFKAGSACLLKGGRDAKYSNRAIVKLIRSALLRNGISDGVVELLPVAHNATKELLSAVGYVDLCIPRGGRRLIDFVRDTAKVPVIETGAGVVHAYFDKSGDLDMGRRITDNAKTRRVSVCNALDTLLIHMGRLDDLPKLVAPLADKNVVLHTDNMAFNALDGTYPQHLLRHAEDGCFDTEYMDYAMSVATVNDLDDALRHIAKHGSGHSECIITQDDDAAARFERDVDAACVYRNAPTSFTDGAQFGLGAEIGISTQKLGPRGPMGLDEITTYKWIVEGEGQVRG